MSNSNALSQNSSRISDEDDSSIDSSHENDVSVNENDLDGSHEDREDGLEDDSFFNDDEVDGDEVPESQDTEVFDNESCSDTSIELSDSIDGIPQQPDFGKLPKKLSDRTDYRGPVKVSKRGHNKRALMTANKRINHLEKTLRHRDKLLSKTHKKASATCQIVFPILKSKSTQLKSLVKKNSVLEERIHKMKSCVVTLKMEKSSLKAQLASMKESLSLFKSQNTSSQADLKSLKKENQELLAEVRKLERDSIGSKISKVEEAKMMQAINTNAKIDLEAAKAEIQMKKEEKRKEAKDNRFRSQENMLSSAGLFLSGNGMFNSAGVVRFLN